MSIELKIKSKHLAEEPRIIKHEERKLTSRIDIEKVPISCFDYWDNPEFSILRKRNSLTVHRRWYVRNEARATFLARAYLSYKFYHQAEPNVTDTYMRDYYIIPRVIKMVKKYGKPNMSEDVLREQIKEWVNYT